MGVRVVVAVTHYDWYKVLRDRTDLLEVNWWSPGHKQCRARAPKRGELYLIKLKKRSRNSKKSRKMIAGGGVVADSSVLPCSLAWDTFGVANGAESLPEMLSRRDTMPHGQTPDLRNQSESPICCRILTHPFFFEEENWVQVPASWHCNIVSSKGYDTSEPEGRKLWDLVMSQLQSQQVGGLEAFGCRFGKPQVIQPRRGQGAFRIAVLDSYERRCAVTNERTLPALDAAHIRPFSEGGAHEPWNGLLLRSDIHRLFDKGYVTITPDLKFEVSGRIRAEFENGKDYYEMCGWPVAAPSDLANRPDAEALAWHNEKCFH